MTKEFMTLETVHRAHILWTWSLDKLHDIDYHIKVNDAVEAAMRKAEANHGVSQDTTYTCQWEGVCLEGSNKLDVSLAGKVVVKALSRFKSIEPINPT